MLVNIKYILPLLILFSGCGKTGDSPSSPDSEEEVEYKEISVMSFNILVTHADDEGEQLWSARMPSCIEMINDVQPDIIGIQECRQAQFEGLVAALPDYAAVNIPERLKNFGTCVFYRKDCFDRFGSGYLWFSDTPSVPSPAYPQICDDPTYRTYIWADLRLKGTQKTLRIYSTHFPRKYTNDNADARHKCAQAMVEHAKKECGDDATVFITGDMNCAMSNESGRYCLLPFTSWMKSSRESLPDSKRDDYYSMNSFDERSPFSGGERSIDHIFYRGAEALAYRTVVEQYGLVRFMSDHYPVLGNFNISY